MKHLLNQLKSTAQQATQGRANTRHGTISSYDAGAYAVKVMLQPDNVETGWLPLKSIFIGNGWGIFCPPSIGDAVEIDYQEGDNEVGSIGMRFFNDQDRPLPCPSGEFWLVHKSKSLFKFHNDGSVEVVSSADLNATVGGNLNATVVGSAFLTAAEFIVDAITTFKKAVTVQGLFTYQAGMSGSNSSGGAGAAIQGGITNTSGGISSNGVDLEGHHHTAQGATSPTSNAQK